ncbi:MAG: prepilin-type N-terminal cleavage/methylation domain-containing protein [Solibacillus sp.]
MFNKFKHIKNEKGLTLIELLAVIVILAIIAAIAIPAIGNIIENSKIKALKADAATVLNAGQIYYADGGTGFTLTADDKGTGNELVQLGETTISSEVTVTKEGKISGALKKGTLTLTLKEATLKDIKVDSADDNAEFAKITKE